MQGYVLLLLSFCIKCHHSLQWPRLVPAVTPFAFPSAALTFSSPPCFSVWPMGELLAQDKPLEKINPSKTKVNRQDNSTNINKTKESQDCRKHYEAKHSVLCSVVPLLPVFFQSSSFLLSLLPLFPTGLKKGLSFYSLKFVSPLVIVWDDCFITGWAIGSTTKIITVSWSHRRIWVVHRWQRNRWYKGLTKEWKRHNCKTFLGSLQ